MLFIIIRKKVELVTVKVNKKFQKIIIIIL